MPDSPPTTGAGSANLRRRATIRDVAREAGVSFQTVSRAMNGRGEISEETRRRVLEAGDALGYVPSRFAANLARQKNLAVGLVITSLRNPYYTDLAASLIDEFAERGWQVVIVTGADTPAVETVSRLSRQVDAVVGYLNNEDQEQIRRAARGMPVVLVEDVARVPGICAIDVDFAPGMRDLVAGLRERGARRIGMIDHSGPGDAYFPSERRRWFEAAAGEDAPVVTGDDTVSGGAAGLEELRSSHPDIDAVIAFNDMMAIGAIQRAHQLGLEVPGDVRIAGVDGLSLGAAMVPTLTSLSIDRDEVARSIAALLQDLLTGAEPDPAPRTSRVVPRPEWRESA